MAAEPEHRSIFAVDIEGFSDEARTNPIRLRLHRYLSGALNTLLSEAGIGEELYALGDTGDGFIVSVAPQVSTARLLDPLIPSLGRRLQSYNRGKPVPARMRLRAAVHAGAVLADPAPLHGEAVIHACRLLDSPAIRGCLAATKRPLAVIASTSVYDEVVKHAYGRIDPTAWHPVVARVKETHTQAWAHVPGDPGAPARSGAHLAKPGPSSPEQGPDARRQPRLSASRPAQGRLRMQSGAQVRAAALLDLVDRLLDLEVIADERARQEVLGLLPSAISSAIPRHPIGRIDVTAIVRTCAKYPDGLGILVETIRMLEGDSLPMRRLEATIARIADEHAPSEPMA